MGNENSPENFAKQKRAVIVAPAGYGNVMLQSELDISRNFVNLYNFGRKCYENES